MTGSTETEFANGSPLEAYSRSSFTHEGLTRDIYRRGSGPAVIVIAEMPGITPKVVAFADRVVDLGCTVVMPALFGEPGLDPNAMAVPAAALHMAATLTRACVAKEFTVWSLGETSPIVGWLRTLAAHEHERCGGPGVGAVGMCFTGGYALSMAVDDRLVAPVLSQPSMPIALGRRHKAALDISPADLDRVKERARRGDLEVLGLRFCGDRLAPGDRFRTLERELGEAFVGVEIPDQFANKTVPFPPHGVLTEHLIDAPGQPTRDALDLVLDLFRRRLLAEESVD
ncbi:MAG: dienelactone hydrolase family protein [Microthrixaceae bacterium]|nr:dienelactone hydrolase family protein [Microthrixaceae bacterium]